MLPSFFRRCVFLLIALSVLASAAPPTLLDLTLPYVNDFVWDATRSCFFVSVGTGVLVVDPETGTIKDTIPIGQIADRIAVSDDGQYLYAGIGVSAVINRYEVQNHALDLQINLGKDGQGRNLMPSAMVVLPGQPGSILVALGYWPALEPPLFPVASQQIEVYDGAVLRSQTLQLNVSSLYVRPSDGAIFGSGPGELFGFSIAAAGVAQLWAIPSNLDQYSLPTWTGNLISDREGAVFDLNARTAKGPIPVGSGCLLANDSTGSSAFVAQGTYTDSTLSQYSLSTFALQATADMGANQDDFLDGCDEVSVVKTWGVNGIVISAFQHSGGNTHLVFFHASGLTPVAPPPLPTPILDSSGAIRVPITANTLVYDPTRNVIWAGIPGSVASAPDSIVSMDPATGNIGTVIFAGGEPSSTALSADGGRLYVALKGTPNVSVLDLNAKQIVQTISVASTGANAPDFQVGSLVAVPGQNSVAVVRVANSPVYTTEVLVYQNGVALPNTVLNYADEIFPGDAPTAIYGVVAAAQSGDGSHATYRLIVDQSGVSMDRQLNSVGLGSDPAFWNSLLYDNGNLFTSQGELWTPDTSELLGIYGSVGPTGIGGLPAGFSDQNRVAFMQTTGITLFEVSTFRPVAQFPFSSYQIRTMHAIVRAGTNVAGAAIAGDLWLIPLSVMQPWSSFSGQLQSASTGVQHLDLPVSAISSLPGTSKLLLATPSSAGASGNSVGVLNPASGEVESMVFAGSEPALLAPLSDGSSVYTYLSGEHHVARVNLPAQSRDLLFPADPQGGAIQYQVYDMIAGPRGALAVSLPGGTIAVFDNGHPRPAVDFNTQGAYAYEPATFKLGYNDTGSILYAFNTYLTFFDFKRCAVTQTPRTPASSGVHFLSSTGNLMSGFYTEYHQYNGLLYTSYGDVVDPERSRIVGRFANPGSILAFSHVALDAAAGRIYFSSQLGGQVSVFDLSTFAYLGSGTFPVKRPGYSSITSLVSLGDGELAYLTSDGDVYLVQTSSIPLLASPVPSPQPSLPSTPGVSVIDLASQDIAYDSSRDILYSSVPNSEAALGDHIAAFEMSTENLKAAYPAGMGPRLLALSSDQNFLNYTSGLVNNVGFNGFSLSSEGVRSLNLATGTVGSSFATPAPVTNEYFSIQDMVALPGQPQSVAAIWNGYQNYIFPDGTSALVNLGPVNLQVFDSGVPRADSLDLTSLKCSALQSGSTAASMFCASASSISQLSADQNGVSAVSTSAVSYGAGTMNHLLFNGGRIFTTTGLVFDAKSLTPIAWMPAQGPIAIDGDTVYWLDPSASLPAQPSVVLKSFDVATLEPIASRQINVSSADVTRLVAAGQGRVAFRAGKEIYVAYPDGSHTGVVVPALPPQLRLSQDPLIAH